MFRGEIRLGDKVRLKEKKAERRRHRFGWFTPSVAVSSTTTSIVQLYDFFFKISPHMLLCFIKTIAIQYLQ